MNRSGPPSLLGRAVLAIALSVGFYALALGVAVGLLFLPYEYWRITGYTNAQSTVFCVVTAVLILYSVLPRPDVFEAPGPRLSPTDHPRLRETMLIPTSRLHSA